MDGILTDVGYTLNSIDIAILGLLDNPEYGCQVGCTLVDNGGSIISQSCNMYYSFKKTVNKIMGIRSEIKLC